MKSKTIAFVINSLNSGGAERVLSTLSNELIGDYEVVIITLVACSPFYRLNTNIKVVYCQEQITPSKNIIEALKSNYSLYKKIKFHLKRNNVDICIGFMTTSNVLATLASKKCRIPVIISERNNPYMEDQKLSSLWKWMRKRVYPLANKIIVQTEKIKSYYEGQISEQKLHIIPNPINPDFKDTPIGTKENIILNVGRLTDQKAQGVLIQAFSNVKPNGWKLHIVGEGPNRVKLEKLINELNMQDHIKLLGRSNAIASHYQQSKIFAFTSIYEGFPNALMEAMYFGLACISTNCPTGPSELIENNKNGYLIPVDSPSQLKDKLNLLMSNDTQCATMGNAARASMHRFNIETIANEWTILFKNIIAP